MNIEQHYRDNFSTLVKKYSRSMGSVHSAEDVVQEAYYRALKYGSTYNGTNFDGWFGRILINSLRDFKAAERGRGIEQEADEQTLGTISEQGLDAKTIKEIKELISTKSVQHREILNLYFIHGYKLRDILAIVDMKRKTVDQCLQRFKKELKEIYGVS